MQRKPCIKFYFSVEGRTEELYLQWLQKKLNCHSKQFRISFDIKVKDPIGRVKGMTISQKVTIYHLCDFESLSEEHQKKFKNLLDQMCEAEGLGKQVKYQLGYCNFSFELWILMHVTNSVRSLANRSQYLNEINANFGENYSSMKEFKREENLKHFFEKLSIEDVKHAVVQAKRLMREKEANPEQYKKFFYFRDNPALSLGEIFEEILWKAGLIKKES